MSKSFTENYEQARLSALKNMNILNSEQDQELDWITREAQSYFKSKSCLISIIGEDRQWFKSKQGIEGEEPPKSISFCTYAIAEEEYLIVPDATLDKRFSKNPLVTGPPFIRAYAGSILHSSEGYEVGTFCVLFDQPRSFSEEEIVVLQRYGSAAEKALLNGYSSNAE